MNASSLGCCGRRGGAPRRATAAHLGASNGDRREFFELFAGTFADLGFSRCMHVRAERSAVQRAFLAQADVILLAGGDVDVGYRALEAAQLIGPLRTRRSEGAVLMGVSAGAIQLGAAGVAGHPGLGFVPYVVDVHDEPAWGRLSASIERLGGAGVGIGIPKAGAAVVNPDRSVETIRKPITEVTLQAGVVQRRDLVSLARPGEPSQRSHDWAIH